MEVEGTDHQRVLAPTLCTGLLPGGVGVQEVWAKWPSPEPSVTHHCQSGCSCHTKGKIPRTAEFCKASWTDVSSPVVFPSGWTTLGVWARPATFLCPDQVG